MLHSFKQVLVYLLAFALLSGTAMSCSSDCGYVVRDGKIVYSVTPRPYSRMYQITGTEGFANKYPNYSFAVKTGNVEALQEADIYNLDAETYVSSEVRDALVELHDRAVWSFMRQWRNAGSDS